MRSPRVRSDSSWYNCWRRHTKIGPHGPSLLPGTPVYWISDTRLYQHRRVRLPERRAGIGSGAIGASQTGMVHEEQTDYVCDRGLQVKMLWKMTQRSDGSSGYRPCTHGAWQQHYKMVLQRRIDNRYDTFFGFWESLYFKEHASLEQINTQTAVPVGEAIYHGRHGEWQEKITYDARIVGPIALCRQSTVPAPSSLLALSAHVHDATAGRRK